MIVPALVRRVVGDHNNLLVVELSSDNLGESVGSAAATSRIESWKVWKLGKQNIWPISLKSFKHMVCLVVVVQCLCQWRCGTLNIVLLQSSLC